MHLRSAPDHSSAPEYPAGSDPYSGYPTGHAREPASVDPNHQTSFCFVLTAGRGLCGFGEAAEELRPSTMPRMEKRESGFRVLIVVCVSGALRAGGAEGGPRGFGGPCFCGKGGLSSCMRNALEASLVVSDFQSNPISLRCMVRDPALTRVWESGRCSTSANGLKSYWTATC